MRSDKTAYLNVATSIALKICRDAVWADDRCNWITSHVEDRSGYPRTFFKTLDSDFYAGTAGVAFFLASLYAVKPDDILKATCYGAIRQALSQLHKFEKASCLGFFSGMLGVAFSVIKAGKFLNDPALTDIGIRHLLKCTEVSPGQCALDVIDGCAGAVPVLLDLYEDLELEPLRKAAVLIGDHILRVKRNEPVGVSWDTTMFKTHNLTGFAHGAAGMVHALFELYEHTGDEKYLTAAGEGVAYENHHYQADEKNWPDFRSFDQGQQHDEGRIPCSCAWCHGAPGIGLSRLRAYEMTGSEPYRTDALAAIETTLKNNVITPHTNFSLCHGLFGNAELLIDGSRILEVPAWRTSVEEMADEAIEKYIAKGMPVTNGVNNTYDNPELMTGLAGMGYFYLRLVNEEKFASVLRVRAGRGKLVVSR